MARTSTPVTVMPPPFNVTGEVPAFTERQRIPTVLIADPAQHQLEADVISVRNVLVHEAGTALDLDMAERCARQIVQALENRRAAAMNGNKHTIAMFEKLWQRRIDEALADSGHPVIATISVTSENGRTRAVLTFDMSDETAGAIVASEVDLGGGAPANT